MPITWDHISRDWAEFALNVVSSVWDSIINNCHYLVVRLELFGELMKINSSANYWNAVPFLQFDKHKYFCNSNHVYCIIFRVQKNPGFLKYQTWQFFCFIGFWFLFVFHVFLFERAVLKWFVKKLPGKFVGWFSSSARLLFSCINSLEYPKTDYLRVFRSFNHKEIFNYFSGMTNRNWIKFGAGFMLVFSWWFLGCVPGGLKPDYIVDCIVNIAALSDCRKCHPGYFRTTST